LRTRSDLASAKQAVTAAELNVTAARAERLPEVSFEASYGAAGLNIANYNQVLSVSGVVTVPLFTGGRIRSEVHQAEATLTQRRAEYRDLEGRVGYDVRVALLDAKASESGVSVAEKNKALAQRARTQAEDRYDNGVTDLLEVVEALEALVAANENYIASLFSFNVAKMSLARAMGSAETRLATLFGGR
jgi:outer membrane protein TolC